MMSYSIVKTISPYKDKVIVCMDTAADLMLLSNGNVFQRMFRVYAEEPIASDTLTVEVLPGCFKSKKYFEYSGLLCTTEEQTMIDMLENSDRVCLQSFLEALANYYFTHGDSFAELEKVLTQKQKEALEEWGMYAVEDSLGG